VRDALLVVDVLNDFGHDEGERLQASFRERIAGLRNVLARARETGVPVIYVNDQLGDWRSDRRSLVERALRGGGGDVIASILPLDSEPLLLKARYSAFDHTGLEILLEELRAERLLVAGSSTEGCVVQTGIHARELGYKVTIVASACATADEERERTALRYAESVAGIVVDRNSSDRGDQSAASPG
jgi:nicotinamidase-related amidase